MDSVLVMIRPDFLSAENRHELERCVRRHREDHGIARRANAILLLDDGESCTQIAKFLYLDDDTIRGWYKNYQEAGWDTQGVPTDTKLTELHLTGILESTIGA